MTYPRPRRADVRSARSRVRSRTRRHRSRRAVAAQQAVLEPAAVRGRPRSPSSTTRKQKLIRGDERCAPCLSLLVFATSAYGYLGARHRRRRRWELGAVERRTFPDGEHYQRIATDPADRDVILVGGTIDDAATLELYDLACGLVAAGAYRLRLVIPYFGYSTMERAVKHGEVVTAKTRARLLSSIPQASARHAGVPARPPRRLDRVLLRRRPAPDPRLRQVARHRCSAPARRRELRARVHRCRPREVGRVARERSPRRRRVRLQAPGLRRGHGASPACPRRSRASASSSTTT